MKTGIKIFILLIVVSFLLILRRFRYLAYRQLTWWGWHHLGRHRRVVLPACAVAKIREEFPSASGEYIGHQYPPPTP